MRDNKRDSTACTDEAGGVVGREPSRIFRNETPSRVAVGGGLLPGWVDR